MMPLLLIDEAVIGAASPEQFEQLTGARVGSSWEVVRGVVRQAQGMLAASPRAPEFGGYLAPDDKGYVVGACGFRAGPSEGGEVEIAYFTFPSFGGRGYATAMARNFILVAFRSDGVQVVLAHTLPEPNASSRVLEKVGMRFCGAFQDPEDGTVWRWQIERAA